MKDVDDGIWKGNTFDIWNAAVRIRSREEHMGEEIF